MKLQPKMTVQPQVKTVQPQVMKVRRVLMSFLAVSAALLGAVLTGLVTAPVASAHSVVTASSPAEGEQIAGGPAQVSITLNEVPQSQFLTLNVVGPDGNLWSKSDPRVEGQSVVVDVGDLGPVGDYTIAYRITSADGHPISGTRAFTLTEAGSGTPGAAADPDAAADSSASEAGSGGVPLWPFLVAGGLVFGGGLAFALRKPKDERKPKGPSEGEGS